MVDKRGFIVPAPPARHLPVRDADYLCRLPPRDSFRHRPENHFLGFHRSLYRRCAPVFHVASDMILYHPRLKSGHF